MSNISTLDLSAVRPGVRIKSPSAYIRIPALAACTVNSEITGASRQCYQYNYSVSNNFTILVLPTTGVGYVPCIRFRSGGVVYRYKLWSGIGENLVVPDQYTNQVIKKNFSIEIYNLGDGNAVTIPADILIKTSLTAWPTGFSLRNLTDYELAVPSATSDINVSGWMYDVGVDKVMKMYVDPVTKVAGTLSDAAVWLDNP